jgi:NAD(P)-dependent dehydrogenase (short-subunit alcohol dehydrogenase family)
MFIDTHEPKSRRNGMVRKRPLWANDKSMDTTNPLQGRIALVTGVGRRAGIGAAICREIAKNGGDVFFTYWRQYDKETHSENSGNDPATIAAELSHFGVRVGSVEIDLSVPDSVEKLFHAVENELGAPSILINNACHDFEVPFVELSPEILDKHYFVNVRAVGPWSCAEAATTASATKRSMCRTRSGIVVTIVRRLAGSFSRLNIPAARCPACASSSAESCASRRDAGGSLGAGDDAFRLAQRAQDDVALGVAEACRRRVREPGKGTGLGLATVYTIVTQAGGTIEVECGGPWHDLPHLPAVAGSSG